MSSIQDEEFILRYLADYIKVITVNFTDYYV